MDEIYTAAQIKLPAMTMDAEIGWSGFSDPALKLIRVNTANVFGFQMNNVGVFAGIKMNFEKWNMRWEATCKAVTAGLVFPVAAGSFTL